MKSIKIETISHVHIGSGRDLKANTEYLIMDEDVDGVRETLLAIIDEEKVLNIIGTENIDKWVSIINKDESLLPYLTARKNNLHSKDVKKRSAIFFGSNASQNRSLKEQLHDGRGKPYIPGSSIKGAIRTAVLANAANNNKALAKNNLKGKKGFSGQELEKRLFGTNPNEDVFRFLQVGDAYFDNTIALKAEIFNMDYKEWKFKKGGSQLIEAIQNDSEAIFKMKINKELLKKNNSRFNTEFLDFKKLFEIVNKHTLGLVKKEIDFFDDINSSTEAYEEYLGWLKEIYEDARKYSENEALLRIGYGSGWRFITGNWATNEDVMNDFDYEKFLSQARRKNYPEDVPFPKSRKIGTQGDIFGFVKLIMEY